MDTMNPVVACTIGVLGVIVLVVTVAVGVADAVMLALKRG